MGERPLMIIYNVTMQIDPSVHDEWLQWMKNSHIPEVMNTGCFTEYRMLKVLGDEDKEEITYSLQYTCKSLNEFYDYEKNHAPKIRAEYNARYKDKVVSFRTLLEIVN